MFADIRQEHNWSLESRRFTSDKESPGIWGGTNLWSFCFVLFSLPARRDNSNPNIILDLSRNSKLLNKQEKNPKTWQNFVGSKVAFETQMPPNQCRNFHSLARVVESNTLTWFVGRGAQEVDKHSADYKVTFWSTSRIYMIALRSFLWHHVFCQEHDSINLQVCSLSRYY